MCIRDRVIEWMIGSMPVVQADPMLMRQVMMNLLSNAVKYTADDKRIRVAVRVEPRMPRIERIPGSYSPDSPDSRFARSDGALAVEVSDHGLGIDKADLDKVFDKFYRGRDERVRATRGSGLGLAIVKHSIEAHGGTIAVQSEPGKGSTFTISLPIRKTLTDGKDTRG